MTYRPIGETIKRGQRPLKSSEIREAMMRMQRTGPRKVGSGSASFSPTIIIEQQPFRWDTNCFYRRLGLDPSATRLDVVRAFQSLEPQDQGFIRFAVAAEVLLSKEKRSRYDRLMIGNFWPGDPDLIASQLDGEMGAIDQDEWAVYADSEVSDEDALKLTSDWRNQLSAVLAEKFSHSMTPGQVPHIGVGVCPTVFHSRWEMVGWYAVYFVPLDAPVTPEYIHAAADELLRIATPTVIRQ